MEAYILIIEDEQAIADTVVYALKQEGFRTTVCMTAAAGISAFRAASPSLMIIDVGLPDVSGFDVVRELRKDSNIPVILLTARTSEIDRVVGLELGADDYVTKPFSPRELAARVKAVLRRTAAAMPAAHSSGFSIDAEKCVITYAGTAVPLSRYEYAILKLLVERPGKVFSRDEIMEAVWDDPGESFDRTIDTHMKTIRQKLHAIKSDADPIITHRGIGYSLTEET
ncbi:MAG: two-component system response regulator CreB [Spirochaetes bacterium]|nr:two-component system response regulator CreB [Spirochaetota bacterium]